MKELGLTERIVRLHEALDGAGLPHAFGGALALAFCTAEPDGLLYNAVHRAMQRLL